MHAMDNDTYWIFVVDTDHYAGNFERPMCAYMTGHIGECEVGKKEAEIYRKEEDPDIFLDESKSWSCIVDIPDEHGCHRPCSIWPNPNWFNNGMGGNFRNDAPESKTSVSKFPSYMSVAIFFEKKPSEDIIKLMKERAHKYFAKQWTSYAKDAPRPIVEGFRLLKRTVTLEEQ